MAFGFGFGFPRPNLSGGFSPASLFAAGEPGGWYDPSDLTTMFQDRAGTTPVTAPGQSVGYRLDKSGRGNHLTAINDAARGTYGIEPLGGRRNLLLFTEQFNEAYWNKTNTSIAEDSTEAPNGSLTADKLIETAVAGTHLIFVTNVSATTTTFTASVYAKASERSRFRLQARNERSPTGGVNASFNLSDQTFVVTSFGDGTGVAQIESVGNGWFRCSLSAAVVTAGTTLVFALFLINNAGLINYTGDGTSGLFIWGAQLELGSTVTAYQRVGSTSFDITEAGAPSLSYVSYDGVDDGYVSPTITPDTDKAQVFAGVRKLSDVARGTVAEMSVSIDDNNGALHLTAPNAASSTFGFESKGTTLADAVATGIAAPVTRVLTGLGDIAGDSTILRANGTQADADTGDQGTGNYLAYPLYIGRRGGTALPFNGRDYGIIVRFGANLSTPTIVQTESFLNQKTGAY
jgi:hypothetical protein